VEVGTTDGRHQRAYRGRGSGPDPGVAIAGLLRSTVVTGRCKKSDIWREWRLQKNPGFVARVMGSPPHNFRSRPKLWGNHITKMMIPQRISERSKCPRRRWTWPRDQDDCLAPGSDGMSPQHVERDLLRPSRHVVVAGKRTGVSPSGAICVNVPRDLALGGLPSPFQTGADRKKCQRSSVCCTILGRLEGVDDDDGLPFAIESISDEGCQLCVRARRNLVRVINMNRRNRPT